MSLRAIQYAEIENKKVLLRADFNVAVVSGEVKEIFKIKTLKETLDYLLKKNCKVAICSHLGRPEGKNNPELSLLNLLSDAEKALGTSLKFIDDCLSASIGTELEKLQENEVLLLENVRFYSEDETNNADFSSKLAAPYDLFVNDAFSVSHRNQASVTGVAKRLDAFAGFRLQDEVNEMEKLKHSFQRPAVAVIGGAKIETKLPVIKFFEKIYDAVLVGGKIANEALDQKIEFGSMVKLPDDFAGERMDIGPRTIENFTKIIRDAGTVVWNGPMGKFEEEEFAKGTEAILDAIADSSAYSVTGGGETLEMVERKNMMDRFDFVSTGGGAMLEYLVGKSLPGIEILQAE